MEDNNAWKTKGLIGSLDNEESPVRWSHVAPVLKKTESALSCVSVWRALRHKGWGGETVSYWDGLIVHGAVFVVR